MRAQGIIFDILEVFGGQQPNTELGMGQIMADILHVHGIGSAPSFEQTQAALALLVATKELVARSPAHDILSVLYRRPS